jgi:hypothetical protein
MQYEGMSIPYDIPHGRPNCGIVACAIAAGVSYSHAWDTAKRVLNRRGQWRGRTNSMERDAIMDTLGVKRLVIPVFQNVQLQNWIRDHARPDQMYLIRTSGHIQAVFNNMVADQVTHTAIQYFWGRRKRVKDVWRIVR